MKSKPAERNSWTKVFPTARRRCSQASCLLTASPPQNIHRFPLPKLNHPSLSPPPAPSRPLPGDPPLSPLVSGEAAMEVVAPGEVKAAPFALCPRFNLLAVGMASAPAAPGSAADSRASRVEVLRLLGPSGNHDLGRTLEVDSVLQAPGLRRVAWSSTTTDEKDDVEKSLYPAGLLAGGFSDGTVRIWSPEPVCDLKNAYVPMKPRPAFILNKDPEVARTEKEDILTGISNMYSDMKDICWNSSEDDEYFQIKENEDLDSFQILDDPLRLLSDSDSFQIIDDDDLDAADWVLISKEEHMAYQESKHMELVTETHDLSGPVLGLSFCELCPYWIAAAGLGERISIHDLHYPISLAKKKREISGRDANSQITCLKWSHTYPCVLATTSDAGLIKLWDIRQSKPAAIFSAGITCSSDLDFSWKDPMHVAVSSINSGSAPAVKIWDMRCLWKPRDAYDGGSSGVVSLSWNRSGHLLASHQNGSASCFDAYQNKMLDDMDFPHCDLGSTWTHFDSVAAAFSSKTGVKLYEVRG